MKPENFEAIMNHFFSDHPHLETSSPFPDIFHFTFKDMLVHNNKLNLTFTIKLNRPDLPEATFTLVIIIQKTNYKRTKFNRTKVEEFDSLTKLKSFINGMVEMEDLINNS